MSWLCYLKYKFQEIKIDKVVNEIQLRPENYKMEEICPKIKITCKNAFVGKKISKLASCKDKTAIFVIVQNKYASATSPTHHAHIMTYTLHSSLTVCEK